MSHKRSYDVHDDFYYLGIDPYTAAKSAARLGMSLYDWYSNQAAGGPHLRGSYETGLSNTSRRTNLTAETPLFGGDRFHAKRLSYRTTGKSKRHRRPHNALKVKDLLASYYPVVYWNLIGGAALTNQSDIGKQLFVDDGAGDHRIAGRGELQDVYNKLYKDLNIQTQIWHNGASGTYSDTKGVISTDAAATDANNKASDFPSLQCLGWQRTCTFTNVSQGVAYIEVYEYTCKEDIDSTLKIQWGKQLIEGTLWRANTAANTYGSVYGVKALPSNDADPKDSWERQLTDPGIRPWKNLKCMKDEYKILKKTRYKMEPGSHINHVVNVRGFSISHDDLYHNGLTQGMIRDLTVSVAYFQIGERCYDNDDGVQKLSYLTTDINYEYKDKTAWRMRPRIRKSFRFTTNAWGALGTAFNDAMAVPVADQPAVCVRAGNLATEIERTDEALDNPPPTPP